MRHHDTFGLAGGTGGINGVGGVIRAQANICLDTLRRQVCQFLYANQPDGQINKKVRPTLLCHHDVHPGIRQHETPPLSRMLRVQRNIHTASRKRAQNGDHQFRGWREAQRHCCTPMYAAGVQGIGQPPGLRLTLAIGKFSCAVTHRYRVGLQPRVFRKDRCYRTKIPLITCRGWGHRHTLIVQHDVQLRFGPGRSHNLPDQRRQPLQETQVRKNRFVEIKFQRQRAAQIRNRQMNLIIRMKHVNLEIARGKKAAFDKRLKIEIRLECLTRQQAVEHRNRNVLPFGQPPPVGLEILQPLGDRESLSPEYIGKHVVETAQRTAKFLGSAAHHHPHHPVGGMIGIALQKQAIQPEKKGRQPDPRLRRIIANRCTLCRAQFQPPITQPICPA